MFFNTVIVFSLFFLFFKTRNIVPMLLCILSKKTGDSNVVLLNDGLTINLPCEQAAHGYSLAKRIFWFFSGCPCECSMILCIIEEIR